MSSLVCWQSATIHCLQIKRGDDTAFRLFAHHLEFTPTIPTALNSFLFGITLLFCGYQNIRQLAISRRPSRNQIAVHRHTQNLADGMQQVLTHDGVLVGLYVQAHVFRHNQIHRIAQHRQVFNVFRIRQHRARQSLGLATAALVSHVEGFFQLRMVVQHAFVKIIG